jgi:hypothetical protein
MMEKQKSKALFIEGESSEAVASLQQGFSKLFSQVLQGKMPKIYMGDGITTTIKKFKNNKREGISFLLLDLDGPEDDMAERLQHLDLNRYSGQVFWMVQEMEAWFLSQPALLDKLYGKGIAAKLPKKRPQLFSKPSSVLISLTKNTKRGEYHKVRDAVDFLENLDAQQLRKDFPEFDRLVRELAK